MNEFIEKLIGRLEEYKYSHLIERNSEQCEHCKYIEDCENRDCSLCIWDKSIEIVNQLAEEYNNDFCEWMQDDVGEGVYCTKCGQMHIFIDGSPEENDHEFCPYCGKKIKIAPYQPKGE